MSLEIQSGAPTTDGQYVAYTTFDTIRPNETVPCILWFINGGWFHRKDAAPWHRPVVGWTGPLAIWYDL